MVFSSMVKKRAFTVFSADNGYRYEFNENGRVSRKIFTVWTSDKHKFPSKIINHIDGSNRSGMELKDIEPWTPDATSFEVPVGYQVMDIPEMMP
jgi:hypothetical protein